MPRALKDYAVYAGEKFLDVGTVPELAERFDVAPETIRFWASPANQRRMKRQDGTEGDRLLAIKLDDEE